ncbi:MAG: helix-turn-helix domain-containing protein [Oscillospiraceae bacterium]
MSKQYNILVVEDEEIERNALVMMIQYNCRDIGEIRTAENGIMAIETLRTFLPDIVFMDINLPGINGLEAIKLMSGINSALRFVIISAHSQFAYAQEALRLGVYDFLVKPIKHEEINRVLTEIIDQTEKSRSKRESEKIQQEKMELIRPVLESDCVFSIASMRSNTPISVIFDFMQIRVNSGFVFIIRSSGHGNAVLNEVKLQLKNVGMTCIGEIINELSVFVALSENTFSAIRINDTMRHISRSLKGDGIECHIGVGEVAVCADDLRRSYEQGLSAVRFATVNGSDIVLHNQIIINKSSSSEDLSEAVTKICTYIRSGENEKVADEVRKVFVILQLNETNQKLLEQAYWLYVVVNGYFPEIAADTPPLSIERVFSYKDSQALRDTLIASFIEMADMLRGQETTRSNKTAIAAMQIVNQRYMDNLTLDDIAAELNFSMFYLSKLFKKQTGTTFTDYLTKCRIEKAKEFLLEGKMSVKEIAFATGYNSQGYFSKIFRKYTGVSPSEYK